MDKFADILKDLVLETGLSVNQIAKKSGVSATQYGKYLKGSFPNISVALRISKFFDCSLDYLFGLVEEKKKNKYDSYDLGLFVDRYTKLLEENKISNWKFAQNFGFSESSLRRWKKFDYPNLETLIIIAKELSSSIDYLVGGKNL